MGLHDERAERHGGDTGRDAPGVGATNMWFAVLGPIEAYRDGVPVDVGPRKQRVLLAALLFRSNAVVPVDELVDMIWAAEPPRTARKNLQLYVSALRKVLGGRIRHAEYGYSIAVADEELDLLRFARLAAAGRKAVLAGSPDQAGDLLHQALSLWRERPGIDLMANSFIVEESNALMEQYVAAYEDWVDLEIDAGRHLAVVEKLGALARLHPFRERLTTSLMTALCRAGNRREALAHYEKHRQLMARELGLAPSPVLQRHYRDILAGAAASSPAPAGPVPARSGARPAQLPNDLPDFVDRREQVSMLVDTLGRDSGGPEVAVVTGHTGTGKTALAVHAGHLLARRFTDGQVFVAMRDEAGAPRPWPELLTQLLRGAGSHAPLPRDEAAAVDLWRSWIADRSFLIVLDDAPDEAATRRLLPGRGANSTIVTSCRTLGGLEAACRIELTDLRPAAALELLERVLGAPRTQHAQDAVRRIVARCGGQPLVIRIVAAKLTVLRHLSVCDYADRLDAVDDVLEELAIGDRSVRGRLQRAYRGLPPRQQAAFRALGTLPSPIADEAAILAALRRVPGPPRHTLEELIDANLIAAAPDLAPDAEVMAHRVSYLIPTAAYLYSTTLRDPGRNSAAQ